MAVLTRDQIMQADDLRTELIAVPEWGGEVIVKALTGRERDAFEASIAGERQGKRVKLDLENIRARFVAACVVDEAGQPLFYPSDVALLGEKSAAALQRVFEVGQRLSGLSDGDVEELAGN